MRRFVPITAVAIAFALMSPIGMATWSAFGSHEPDNSLDTSLWMWENAPASGEKRVYFNVISMQSTLGNTPVNPNVGVAETRTETMGIERNYALLGVWTDCNGDGYIGYAESALREYPDQLLLDKTRCAPTAQVGGPNNWNGANNYRGLVTEFIPVAGKLPAGSTYARDTRLYIDLEAHVWGDYGSPGQSSEDAGGGTCAITPLPRGTLQSTGGALNHLDCYTGIQGAMNRVAEEAGQDPFFPNDPDATGSDLDMPTFGSEDSQYSALRPFDCNAAPIVRSGDVLNDSGFGSETEGPLHNVVVRPPSGNPVGNTAAPTIPGTINETFEEIGFRFDEDGNPVVDDECDTSNDRGADFYGILEGDFNSNPPTGKHESDWNFQFGVSNRGGAPVSLLGAIGGSGSSGMDESDLGIYYGGSGWDAIVNTVKAFSTVAIRTGLDTEDPTASDPGVDIAGPYVRTFYAYVGSATTARGFALPGGSAFYGTEQCGSNDSGIFNGWDCDGDNWNLNPDGTPLPQDGIILATIGSQYVLRDVDCADGGVGDTGVGIQPAAYGEDACV